MQPMVTKNHKQSMSQPERAFWRDAFLAGPRPPFQWVSLEEEIKERADFADAAVQELRRRLTWRNTHDQ